MHAKSSERSARTHPIVDRAIDSAFANSFLFTTPGLSFQSVYGHVGFIDVTVDAEIACRHTGQDLSLKERNQKQWQYQNESRAVSERVC